MANIPELERVLGHIKAHPEQHDQTWFYQKNECGTTACFAGWTCLLNGYSFSGKLRQGETRIQSWIADDIAKVVLDLDQAQVNALFYRATDLQEVEAVVKAISNNEDVNKLTLGEERG